MPGGALRAAVARVGAEAGERHGSRAPRSSSRRGLHRAGRPPSGRCGSPARSACRRRRGCRPWVLRIRNSRPAELGRVPAHADVLRPAEQVAARPGPQFSAVNGRLPPAPALRRDGVRFVRSIRFQIRHYHFTTTPKYSSFFVEQTLIGLAQLLRFDRMCYQPINKGKSAVGQGGQEPVLGLVEIPRTSQASVLRLEKHVAMAAAPRGTAGAGRRRSSPPWPVPAGCRRRPPAPRRTPDS